MGIVPIWLVVRETLKLELVWGWKVKLYALVAVNRKVKSVDRLKSVPVIEKEFEALSRKRYKGLAPEMVKEEGGGGGGGAPEPYSKAPMSGAVP